MSFNVGATIANPIVITPNTPTMTMTPNTATIEGTSNIPIDVDVTLGQMSMTSFPAQIGNNVIVQPPTAIMGMTPLNTVIDFTPGQGDVTVDVNTASMSMQPNNAGIVAPSSGLENDWILRSTLPGVVWNHNFGLPAEVDQFRWSGGKGNDPDDSHTGRTQNSIRHNTADGITGGGCLETWRPAGTSEGKDWWRVTAPLLGTANGKGVDDPGANGRLAPKDFDPTFTSETEHWISHDFKGGFYGHPVHAADFPSQFDGHDFWFQCRIKLDSRRWDIPFDAGKLFYFTWTEWSLSDQEIVVMQRQDANIAGAPLNFLDMYRSGSPPLRDDDPTNDTQPGGELGQCEWVLNNTFISGCWTWPKDEWCTVMWHVVPSRDGVAEETVEVYAMYANETSFSRVWNQRDIPMPMEDFDNISNPAPKGYNALICTPYSNGNNYNDEFTQRVDEMIWSWDPIPPPLAQKTALQSVADGLNPGQWADFTPNPLGQPEDIQWQTGGGEYWALGRKFHYMGKDAGPVVHTHYIYDEVTDSWSTTGTSLFPGTGHIWTQTFDPIEGDYYFRRSNTNHVEKWDRFSEAWTTTATQTSPPLNGGNANWAAMGFHPNLFGPGEPGIFVWAVFRFFAYNTIEDQWSVLNPSNFPSNNIYYDRAHGQGIYLQDTDQLICFADNRGNGHNAILVEAGAGLSSDIISAGLVSTTSAPPVEIAGFGGTDLQGHATLHPRNPSRLLVLEEHGSGSVWKSDDYGASWQTDGTHPFDSMPTNLGETGAFTIGPMSTPGVICGLTSNGSGGHTRLWKPNN